MSSTLTNLLYHVVFSTKFRQRVINDDLANRLHPYMGGIVRLHGGIALEIGGIEDHVHMLVRLKSSISVADLVRLVKTGSSKWVHDQLKNQQQFGWQTGYGAFTVSESSVNRVRAYIRNQREHHRKKSFQDEFVSFLKKHQIDFEPKYIFD